MAQPQTMPPTSISSLLFSRAVHIARLFGSSFRRHAHCRKTIVICVAFSAVGLIAQSRPGFEADHSPAENVPINNQQAHAPYDAFVEWAKVNSVQLQTPEPVSEPTSDLRPLGQILGAAKIIALGEATHGTHEFFTLKHRLLQYIANSNRETVFSIEGDMTDAYRLNDFVLNGKGDPESLIKGMGFWTWDTKEMLDMVLWMRDFNSRGKGRLQFTGFDMQNPVSSIGVVQTFAAEHGDPSDWTLLQVLRKQLASSLSSPSLPNIATATLPVREAVGKHVVFSGYIKTQEVSQGFAALWLRVDGKEANRPLVFDNMEDRAAKGTTPWRYYEISVDVPTNATNINFGLLHSGDGTAWFGSLKLVIDGEPYLNNRLFVPSFGSTDTAGFRISGAKYEFTIDKAGAYEGRASLQSHFVQDDSDTNANAQSLMGDSKRVLEDLEAQRDKFRKKGATGTEIDWVIQNARLIFEFLEMRAGAKSRDESMAENVEWIANHNPTARLVLWAHNAHVAYTYGSDFPMAYYLKKRFGSQLLNFGFLFNTGRFRAVEIGKGLREFRVNSAPDYSLESSLSAIGGILIIDLRKIPRQGVLATWFEAPHMLRSIGSTYDSKETNDAFIRLRVKDAFDVLVFVAATTPSLGMM
jgi:erythromycin esterase-like protein